MVLTEREYASLQNADEELQTALLWILGVTLAITAFLFSIPAPPSEMEEGEKM